MQELAYLTDQERAISARRRRLHARIDFVRATGAGSAYADQQLTEMIERERRVSADRRAIHHRIDETRLALGLPRFKRESGTHREDLLD